MVWGSSFPAIKFIVSLVDEATYTWMRGAVALISLSPYILYQLSKKRIDRRTLVGGLWAGVAFTLGYGSRAGALNMHLHLTQPS
jgi:drug/metabolite transporter (DMT)-like permease